MPSPPSQHPSAHGSLWSHIIDLPAGQCSTVGQCGNASELAAYVIEGILHISVGGSLETLEQGDTIVFSSNQALLWSADIKPTAGS